MLGRPTVKTPSPKCSLLYLLTILSFTWTRALAFRNHSDLRLLTLFRNQTVSHPRLKYSKIRSWDQPTNKAKWEFTLHYDQSKLTEPDTLKDLFCSAHVWLFCSYFIMHENKKFRTLVPPSVLGCAVGQNLIFPPLLLSPDIAVLLKPPEITSWLLIMHGNSKSLFFYGFLASFPKPYSSYR